MTFLPHLHKDLRDVRHSRRGATHKPEDVPIGLHKEYGRMERIKLPEPNALQMTLEGALAQRRSAFEVADEKALSLDEYGTLFGHALRKRGGSVSRNYPSGGALYPIETYLFTTRFEGRSGILHYNPTAHALEYLWDLPPDFDMWSLARGPDTLHFSSLIVFTSVWKRSSAKYGDFTYTAASLEAGHMAENIILVGTALGLATRPLIGFFDDRIIELLDLDRNEEQPIHSVVIGKSIERDTAPAPVPE